MILLNSNRHLMNDEDNCMIEKFIFKVLYINYCFFYKKTHDKYLPCVLKKLKRELFCFC